MKNESITPVLSAQERAIVDGKKVMHGTATDRVLRMFDAIRSYGPPRVALERAIYFTESFRTTEGNLFFLTQCWIPGSAAMTPERAANPILISSPIVSNPSPSKRGFLGGGRKERPNMVVYEVYARCEKDGREFLGVLPERRTSGPLGKKKCRVGPVPGHHFCHA